MERRFHSDWLYRQLTTHVDEVIGDNAQAHPSSQARHAAISASCQAMSPFEHADSAFASGSPLLAVLEPASLLQSASFLAVRAPVRYGNVLHSQRLRSSFIGVGIIARIGSD